MKFFFFSKYRANIFKINFEQSFEAAEQVDSQSDFGLQMLYFFKGKTFSLCINAIIAQVCPL